MSQKIDLTNLVRGEGEFQNIQEIVRRTLLTCFEQIDKQVCVEPPTHALFPVSYLLSPVSCLLSPVSCLLSPVSCLLYYAYISIPLCV
jgi:hypothetical protein